MSAKPRSHNRIFGSKIVYPALDGYIVEYDFAASPTLTDADVKGAVAAEASGHGVHASSITVRRERANSHAVVVVRLELDKAQFDAINKLVSEPGWVQHHFLDKGLVIVGMRVETRILVSFATSKSRHREDTGGQNAIVPLIMSSAKGFDRKGRRYELSDDGRDWVDVGPSSPLHCGCWDD